MMSAENRHLYAKERRCNRAFLRFILTTLMERRPRYEMVVEGILFFSLCQILTPYESEFYRLLVSHYRLYF
jgi:hypothetical protein